MKKRIAIVGGSSVDVFATSDQPLIAHDSNPGRVTIGFGGVGRNIAENLAYLEQDVLLIAAFGQDPFSIHMLAHTAYVGVNTTHTLIIPEKQSPYYISVNDCHGEMEVAIADLRICDLITPFFLSQKLSVLNECDAVIVDANLSEEAIQYLAHNCTPPLMAEAVSTRKAVKLKSSLPHLFAVKANLQETESLIGEKLTSDLQSLTQAANKLHAFGISHVLITMGRNGAFYSDNGNILRMEAYQTKTVNTNGCGDAFSAAGYLAILCGKDPTEIMQSAMGAAAITTQSEQAVFPGMSFANIDRFLQEARKQN